MSRKKIQKLLVANRSEIAIRIFRTATELGITTVAVYAEQDKLSLHRFKADEAYLIGVGMGPIEAYLSIEEIIKVAVSAGVDAIHPGYGFLAESPEFADACASAGIVFIGPTSDTMRALGNKIAARDLAQSVGVPVMPASPPLPNDPEAIRKEAAALGYPLMLKASWGGGGRGMRPIEDEAALAESVAAARREARSAFGKEEVYLEKLVQRARHIEVQILGDASGGLVHLFERDCSIQRRRQKIIERAPAPFLEPEIRDGICEAALQIARAVSYRGAGTVEFLVDAETGTFYFIEVNPRIQVEHTVTEMVTGIDIVRAQICIAEGAQLDDAATGVPPQCDIRLNGHAIQCRITTENPENHFVPDHGRITAFRGSFGFGIRVDGGTAYAGAVVTRFYDPLLEKVTAWAPTAEEAVVRMLRALCEYRIRGVATNLRFLERVLGHPRFREGAYTTAFLDETPELFQLKRGRDRATKLLGYIADVTVNSHPDVKGRPAPAQTQVPGVPVLSGARREGTRQRLEALGPRRFAAWMKDQARPLVTDTTMRDAHQSLLATRMRSFDICRAGRAYADGLPELLSLECWGGATFDVAMRFLREDPWERLALLRQEAPNILLQMLLRGANGVGYTNYPDNAVRFFIRNAAEAGVDLFRIFDCFNWVENMRVAIDAVGEAGKLAEGAICYTGDILDPTRPKHALTTYVRLAEELERAGCHILAIKDMAGLLKPAAARLLIRELKQVTSLPIHLHTHDTSGVAAATVLAAVEAGVDAFDAAMDPFSGLTSQPCLGSLVEVLHGGEHDTGLDREAIRKLCSYWREVRTQYAAFESDLKSGASEIYWHEMPGGQFTNLMEQARAMGLEGRWEEVANAYRSANDLLGDIVKVTPSSKVVGDLALMMVSRQLSAADLLDPARDIAFPQSVAEMLRGDLGQVPGGWPEGIQKSVLRGAPVTTERPGAVLPAADLEGIRGSLEAEWEKTVSDRELASALMYPKVFAEFVSATNASGPVYALPTPVFFYGMKVGQEINVQLEPGKSLVIILLGVAETDEDGNVQVFFELNGQPRFVKVPNRAVVSDRPARLKGNDNDPGHVSAPMPGVISLLAVERGAVVRQGDVLLSIEAMKMETTVKAPRAGVVASLCVSSGDSVDAKDLLLEIEA